MTDIFPESREEEILVSTINGEEYDKAPESRIEALLLELKEVIEEGGGGGGGSITYLDNGKVGQASPAVYVNVPLDVPMVPGMFKVTLKDNGEEETRYIDWSESETFSFSGGKDLLITATTAGLTHYDGSYRDIYCDIVSVGNSNNYNDLTNKPSINDITLSGNKTSADLGIPTDADLAGKQDVLPVTASGNDVAFNGDIIDGQGNTLSVLAEALTKTASGNPVTITDCAGGKARSLITSINAIQDLHGYDYPWAGGAGKNKWPFGDFNGTYSNVPFSLAAGTYTASKTNPDVNCGLRFYYADNTSIAFTFFTSETFTLTADVVKINYSSADETTENFMIESGTTATPFAPYSNICPISGRTAVAVDDVGKNMLSTPYSLEDRNNVYYTLNTDGSFTLNGTTNGTYYAYIKNLSNSAVLPVGTYTFSLRKDGVLGTGNLSARVRRYNHGVADDFNDFILNNGVANVPIVNADDVCAFFASANSGVNCNGTYSPQIEKGTSASAFEPYQHSSATIQLGTTVYGADINWDTGVATVTTAVVDMGSLEWFRANTHRFQSTGLNGLIYPNSDNVIPPDMKCEIYKPFAASQTPTTDFGITAFHFTSDNTTYLRALDANIDDLTAFMAQIDGKKLEYKLATPTTIQLTPTQLEMLKGYNRVTIESGTITLDYIAKAISGNDEEIAPLVGDKATKSYAVNDFIERNDGLYRVTASIASGASFTANNTVKMSIGEALTYLYNK